MTCMIQVRGSNSPALPALPDHAAVAAGMSMALNQADFRSPAILLSGTVDYAMYRSFRDQPSGAPGGSGGALDPGRRSGGRTDDGRGYPFHHDLSRERRFVFLGKGAIYMEANEAEALGLIQRVV